MEDFMENIENAVVYTVSRHCMERYAERIMKKEEAVDINRFITLNEEKIKTDVNKLITFGQLIFSGKQSHKEGKGNIIDVYLRDCWVVLVDNRAKNVVTLYKISLGLDEDFNKVYIAKMLEKLDATKAALEETKQQVQAESDSYKEIINDTEAQIKDYRAMIKNLEELCTGYRTIIDNNIVKIAQANKDVIEVVNTLIGKKEF
jgi:flagellar capping protein FliD